MPQLIFPASPPAPLDLYPAPSGDRSLYQTPDSQRKAGRIGKVASEKKFRSLVKRWKKETSHLSSASQMASHPAYQEIIGMGREVVSLLLAELKRKPDFWFAALRAIAGENPVPPESVGRIEDMARAWVEWGRSKGYIE